MTHVSIDVDAITRISSAEEAQRIGFAANEALLADLRTLTRDQWETLTVCAPWTITDMVRHLVGATKANTSTREMLRQQIYGARHKSAFDGNALDATNDLQVSDHRHLAPEQLLVELEALYPKSVRTRTGRSRIFNRVNVPIDAGGSTATGMPRRLNLGELFRVVYTRDVWLHRIDIARALGREPEMEPTADGRIIEDVVKDWADRHGQPFDLRLTGAAGGDYRRTGAGPVIELDAVDFCWILSGRGQTEAAAPGASLLAHRVLF